MTYQEVFNLFYEHIEKPVDLTDCIWFEENQDYICWNEENNLEDLLNIEGNTYQEDILKVVEIGGYTLYTLPTLGGGTFQAIFDLSKKQDAAGYRDNQ